MKTFSDCQIMVGISCLLLVFFANGITADIASSEIGQRPNLRRPTTTSSSSGTQNQQQNPIAYPVRSLQEFENHDDTRSLEEIEKIEEEFSGENEENKVTENETDELEKIEEEFDGGNDNNNNNNENESEAGEEIKVVDTAEEEVAEEQEQEQEEELVAQEVAPVSNEPTAAPQTKAPVVAPTTKPYQKDDGYDPIKAEDEKHAEEEAVQELQTELKQEEKVARRAGGLGIFFGILAMIFTAHQMSENPDGIYASVCRLAITISSVVVKIVCMPCRKVLGIGGNGNPYSGHMPISTSDYGYRNDPYRSNANAGFEMS